MKKTGFLDQPGMHQDAPPRIFEFARINREKPTEAEEVLWNALKNNQLAGQKFRRQHPIGYYIVDFYCHARKLAIELDGGYHDDPKRKVYDEYRTAELARVGIREIRFRNEDLFLDFWGVLEGILMALEEGASSLATPDP